MGPAAAFSLIGFLRALGKKQGEGFKLSHEGYAGDEHPVDLARGFLVAYAVQSIPNSRPAKASQYTQQLIQEVENDAKALKQSTGALS